MPTVADVSPAQPSLARVPAPGDRIRHTTTGCLGTFVRADHDAHDGQPIWIATYDADGVEWSNTPEAFELLTPEALAARLDRLGVRVGILPATAFLPSHRFGPCEWRTGCDQPATCVVWPAHGTELHEVCVGCVEACAETCVTDDLGRADRVSVEIATTYPADTKDAA